MVPSRTLVRHPIPLGQARVTGIGILPIRAVLGNARDDLCLSRRGLFASINGRRNDAMLRCTGKHGPFVNIASSSRFDHLNTEQR